jgi:hypothetical protein
MKGLHVTPSDATACKAMSIGLGIALSGCAWLATGKPEPGGTASVTIISGGLLVSQTGQPELGLTLANTATRTLWVSAHFRTPSSTDCLLVKELQPEAKQLYLCPQAAIRADTDYPIHIQSFADLQQTQLLDSLDTSFRFEPADLWALKSNP